MYLHPALKAFPCCAQWEHALLSSLLLLDMWCRCWSTPAAISGRVLGCFMLCGCLCCLDFSALLILSHIPGVCTHSQVPLVPGERLGGHHQLCQGGLISSCSLTQSTSISPSVGRAGKRRHSPFSLFFLPCGTDLSVPQLVLCDLGPLGVKLRAMLLPLYQHSFTLPQ